jgi:hypothetical protein
MKKNTKVRVVENHTYHAGREGYFQFMGGPKFDVAVCAVKPEEPQDLYQELFAVGIEDLIVL